MEEYTMFVAKPIPAGKVAEESDVQNLASDAGAELIKPQDNPLANPDRAAGTISPVPGVMDGVPVGRKPAAPR